MSAIELELDIDRRSRNQGRPGERPSLAVDLEHPLDRRKSPRTKEPNFIEGLGSRLRSDPGEEASTDAPGVRREPGLASVIRRISAEVPWGSTDPEELLGEARRLHEDGALEEAFRLYGEVLLARPLDPAPLAELERIAARSGRQEALADLYARLLRENPSHPSQGTLTRRIGGLREASALAGHPGPDSADSHGATAKEAWAPGRDAVESVGSVGTLERSSGLDAAESFGAVATQGRSAGPNAAESFGAVVKPARNSGLDVAEPDGSSGDWDLAPRVPVAEAVGPGGREWPPRLNAAEPSEAGVREPWAEIRHASESDAREGGAIADEAVELAYALSRQEPDDPDFDLGTHLFGSDGKDGVPDAIGYELGSMLTSSSPADEPAEKDTRWVENAKGGAPSRFAIHARRLGALVADATVLAIVPLAILGIATNSLSGEGEGLISHLIRGASTGGPMARAALSLALLFAFTYCTLCWALGGRTFGGFITGLRAVDVRDGEPPSFGRAAIRAAFAILGTAAAFAGPLWALVDPEGRTLHDRLSRTSVVVD